MSKLLKNELPLIWHKPLYFKMKFFKNIFRALAFFFFKLAHNEYMYKNIIIN